MISHARPDHFHTPNFTSLNEKSFGHENTGWAIEASERVGLTCGQHARIHRALIEDHMGPNDTTLLINNRIAPIVDVLNDEVVTEFELRKAIHRIGIDSIRILGSATTRRNIGRWCTIFDAVTVIGEGVGTGS